MTSNSCHTGGFPRYFYVLSSFASRHQTATEGEVQGGEGGTGGGFAETGTDPPIGDPPNRILTPPNSSHPPLLASGIPQTGDPPRDRFRGIMSSGNELHELPKFWLTPQN